MECVVGDIVYDGDTRDNVGSVVANCVEKSADGGLVGRLVENVVG